MTAAGPFNCLNRSKKLILIGLSAFVLPFVLMWAAGIRINCSPSMPLGFYKTTSDPNAPLVEFCPPEPYGSYMAKRGYRSAGNCPDGGSPLMKPVIGVAGDVVEASPGGLAVNGVWLINTAPSTSDTKGRSMTPWPSGKYRVPIGFVWVASTYTARSFDSRYLGPIPTAALRGNLVPLLTF
jgi:conjugative transfer signal peptidase TraF